MWPPLKYILPETKGTAAGEESWVRYCLEKDSAEQLYPLLLAAIARWEPAAALSSLRIVPDIGCMGDFFCICDPDRKVYSALAMPDVLEIRFGDETITNVGYQGRKIVENADVDQSVLLESTRERTPTVAAEGPAPGQQGSTNAILVQRPDGAAVWDYPTNRMIPVEQVISWQLTHELGHIMGFLHEHQRPDAQSGNWIEYHCGALSQYEDVLKTVEADDSFSSSMSPHERMERVCSDFESAKKYGFEDWLNWMPQKEGVDEQGQTVPATSADLDFRSVMLYGSGDRMIQKTRRPRTPILKHPSRVEKGETNWIAAGGTVDWARKSISVYDIERVAQLYPRIHDQEAVKGRIHQSIAIGAFDPVEFDVQQKQAEIRKVLTGVGLLQSEVVMPETKPGMKPFRTAVYPSPTDAYNRRLDVVYRAGVPGFPRFGKARGT